MSDSKDHSGTTVSDDLVFIKNKPKFHSSNFTASAMVIIKIVFAKKQKNLSLNVYIRLINLSLLLKRGAKVGVCRLYFAYATRQK